MADGIGKSFETLPIHHLICTPILAVADGQAELCRIYLQNLFKLAFKNVDNTGNASEVNSIKFNLNRMVIDESGNTQTQTLEVEAPLLALVPVPALTMDEATVRFTMEIKEVEAQENKSSEESSFGAGYSAFGFKANISGKVSASSQHTRSSDHSAKYDIYARAVQQPPAEGMAKLSAIFASVIEPISASGGGK